MYKFFRNILFLFPPEWVHYFSMNLMKVLCSIGFIRKLLASGFTTHHSRLTTHVFNLVFKNPIGLGAGFDKNAKYLRELETLGFGFIEIGTVTPLPQAGNDKPRLFRLPKDKALINRMGFNNDGVKVVAERLRQWSIVNGQSETSRSPLTIHHSRIIIGGNIGKNKTTPNEEAWKDYEICFRELFDWVDYFVVNVSSPNTGPARVTGKRITAQNFIALQTINKTNSLPKPLLLKIALINVGTNGRCD
jgi:dihydroorotate dehydrogenase